MRLDARLFDVSNGKVLVTAAIVGSTRRVFDVEQQLVEKLVAGIDAKLKPAVQLSGCATLNDLNAYSRALQSADKGYLDEAQKALGEIVRASPDFRLARQRYAELIKRLHESQKQRGSALEAVDATLQQHIDAWRARWLAEMSTDDDVTHYFGYLHAHCNLQLVRMRQLLAVPNDVSDPAVWVPESKRAELAKLERAWLDGAERLIADKRAFRKRGRARNQRAELSDADNELGKHLSGKNLAEWSFSSASSIGIDAAEVLLAGRTPWHSDVDRFSVRPAPVQRDPALRAKAEALIAAAVKELPLDSDEDEVVQKTAELQDVRAEGFVLEGKKEDAVAQWQLFLDRYPKSDYFPKLSKKVEHLLLISDEVEAAQKQLDGCDAQMGPKLLELAKRIARADGLGGLARMAERMSACARKHPESRTFWDAEAFMTPARAALAGADCPAFLGLRQKAGRPLDLKQACDEP
jgi:hypothetical protein